MRAEKENRGDEKRGAQRKMESRDHHNRGEDRVE